MQEARRGPEFCHPGLVLSGSRALGGSAKRVQRGGGSRRPRGVLGAIQTRWDGRARYTCWTWGS